MVGNLLNEIRPLLILINLVQNYDATHIHTQSLCQFIDVRGCPSASCPTYSATSVKTPYRGVRGRGRIRTTEC